MTIKAKRETEGDTGRIRKNSIFYVPSTVLHAVHQRGRERQRFIPSALEANEHGAMAIFLSRMAHGMALSESKKKTKKRKEGLLSKYPGSHPSVN